MCLESTWAILVTGLVGAALFVAVVGFAVAYLVIKWYKTKWVHTILTLNKYNFIIRKRNAAKPDNQVITYQIGQQMTQEQYNSQLTGSNGQSPPTTPQMPIVYAINNNPGTISAHANFQFGYASYQIQPIGSFACHSSIVRPSKLSMPRRKSVGSVSEVSGVSSRQGSRRSSEPAPLVARTDEITIEESNMSQSCVELEVSEEQSVNDKSDANEPDNGNATYRRQESDSSLFLSRQASETNYDETQISNEHYQPLTCVEVLQCASNSQINNNSEPSPSPPVSPLVIRSGYSSPLDKSRTPPPSQSISPSPDDSPKFIVHISSTTKSGAVDNPPFVAEQMIVPETLEAPLSRRDSSSSSYLGGSSSDSSHHEPHYMHPLNDAHHQPEKPVVPEKPQTPVKRKTSFTVKDLQDEIRSLPLFQRLRKNLGEEELPRKQQVSSTTSPDRPVKKLPISFAKPASPARDPKSSLPPVPKEPQQKFISGRNESSDIDTSTPLAFLDKQFAEDGQYFEETSSDDVMYEKLDQVESPDHDLSHTSEESSDTQTLNHVNVQIGDSPTDSAENTSLDSNNELRNFKQHHELQQNLGQYYGPSAQLSDSSATTSEDMNEQAYTMANKQNAEESSGAEQQSPAPYHTRLRRIYTVPNQRNMDYEREVQSENERLSSMKPVLRNNHIYPKRSPPIMGTKGLRRIPNNGLADPALSGTRSEGELENRSKMYYTDRIPQATIIALPHRSSQHRRESSLRRGQPFRKYPNSPRLGRNAAQNRQTNEQLRQQKSLTDSEEDLNIPSKQVATTLRSSIGGGKRYRSDQAEMARDKERKRMKPRMTDNFDTYLPNDEALLSENFELDQSFFEPVGIRRGGYHRSQQSYPIHISQRSRSSQAQRSSTSESKSLSVKPRPLPRQSHNVHQSVQANAILQSSKDSEYKRKPNLVTPNNVKHQKQSSLPANNSSSVSWDAKKFKHRHKRVQFKDELDEVIAHSPERASDDDGAHVQLPAYHYWRQNLRSTPSTPGQKFSVNILSD